MSLSRPRSLRSLALAFALGSALACANLETRFDRDELDNAEAGLVLGEFPLAKNAIVDGDTIKVDGLDSSLRLLGIDCEETFKNEKAWRAFEVGWEQYLINEQAKTSRPIKVPTPLGMDAKHFAQDFFGGVSRVRLERDSPKEIRDRFNRFLVYVLVERDGQWLNYNVEVVRAGMSPYYAKYGYARRYHQQFVEAEAEARAAKRGIWAEGAQCYQDYDVRAQWWTARAEFVKQFDIDSADAPDLISLTDWDAHERLQASLGEEVEVLGTVGSIRQGERGPKRVLLSRRQFADFPLIFWEDDVFEDSGIGRYRSEFVRVRGVVTNYVDRRSGREQLQIEVRHPSQVRLPDYVPPGEPGSVDVDPEEISGEEPPAMDAPEDFQTAPPKKPQPLVEPESVEPAPVEAAPAEPGPVEPAPVEAAPADDAPVDDAPVEPELPADPA